MMPPAVVLSEFSLAIDLEEFLNIFWIDSQWYNNFLVEKLCDIKVDIGQWTREEKTESGSSTNDNLILCREVSSYHPSKISFPGLPSHAESIKLHTIERFYGSVENKAVIKETNSFRGIPYCDYFSVNIEWVVTSLNKPKLDTSSSDDLVKTKQTNIRRGEQKCNICIFLSFTFHKYTWLQGTIESNTKSEMLSIYELWLDSANDYIRRSIDRNQISTNHLNFGQHQTTTVTADNLTMKPAISTSVASGVVITPILKTEIAAVNISSHCATTTQSISLTSAAASNHSISSLAGKMNVDSAHRSGSNNDGYESSIYPSDDESMFYDCEEGEKIQLKVSKLARSIGSHLPGFHESDDVDDDEEAENNSPKIPQWILMRGFAAGIKGGDRRGVLSEHSSSDSGSVNMPSISAARRKKPSMGGGESLHSQSTSRDIAVSIVETVVVLAQYSFWQVYQVYMYDLKDLFNVESSQVLSRIINSFLPGWHSPILLRPDVYGPLLAVFMLPQSLLLSMEISKVGCNPTSQLGNAVVVSLCLWIGLSAIYRVLAYVIAPPINMKHCLSMTGYSFFSWNLALLCSYPLELYKDSTSIPLSLPLMVFCIPSSLALGCMFWEHTAASNITLKPDSLPTYIGGSTVCVQQFANQNSRCLQRILWAFPKILAFVIVTGTHYQFLWYMAKVFLPGRRQLCRLSALIQPSRYADILTQKEFRNFAIALLSGKKD
mmetsp:Transcript_27612/g.39197  ORF Transcript_27612/g.39197 Transcript_27612/m.39197 type:complete len:718 (+) Transcript_27612:13-2166(+)